MNILEIFTIVASITTPNEQAVANSAIAVTAPERIWTADTKKKKYNDLSILKVDKRKNKGIRIKNKSKINSDI